jgi:hypothetical protein
MEDAGGRLHRSVGISEQTRRHHIPQVRNRNNAVLVDLFLIRSVSNCNGNENFILQDAFLLHC